MALVAVGALAVPGAVARGQQYQPAASAAFAFLDESLDLHHQAYAVYDDAWSAGNHFHTRAAIVPSPGGEVAVSMDESWTDRPHTGATCIRCEYRADEAPVWAGFYFMNGVLLGDDVVPRANWGEYPDAGVDLTGATELRFWARGEHGGEKVDFFFGGVGWNPDPPPGSPVAPYHDSSPRVPELGHTFTLSASWQEYSISLTGHDISYVLGAFGWVATDAWSPQGAVFYLDDISFDKPRLEDPRFAVSYRTVPSTDPFDVVMRNVAFTYDSSILLEAELASNSAEGDRRAGLIAGALIYALDHDRYYSDGRLRNAYQAGELVLPPGWTPNGRVGTVRMPGWWDAEREHWYEDEMQVSTHTGNVAWAALALCAYYERVRLRIGEDEATRYLDAAVRMGNWIVANCRDTRGAGGFTGGYAGWEPEPAKLLWKSTEHNIDCYALFTMLHELTGDAAWLDEAARAAAFVEAMWEAQSNHFWTGTLEDGITVNTATVPLDAQAWPVLAFSGEYHPVSLQYALDHIALCWTDGGTFCGFDFNDDRDGIWWEGTAQMSTALQAAGRWHDALTQADNLVHAQAAAPGGDGRGLVAATPDVISTGFDWEYFARLHTGATSWFAMALCQYDPFTARAMGFADVSLDCWAWAAVMAAARAHIVTGYGDGTYHPEYQVTRDQMAVYVARALVTPSGDAGIPDPDSPPTFPDVPATHWAYKQIEYAVSQHVVVGYADGTYQPQLVVDRGQMAVYIARALVAPSGDAGIPDPEPPNTFPDVPGEDGTWAWCQKHVEYLAGQGIVTGYSDGYYHPEYPVTRDQMAVYVARAFGLSQ